MVDRENDKELNRISFGRILPEGWIRRQMAADLEKGFVGHLDELAPALIREDDIYGADRLTAVYKAKSLGVSEDDVEGSRQLQWWNSETQSNWLDGFLRHAFLLDAKADQKKAEENVRRLLAGQDADGYMGIYAEDMRFHHTFESGELWSQSTLFRLLLGYYEATGEKEALTAVERAVQRIMEGYQKDASEPFVWEQTHGLTINDTLEQLYAYTADPVYLEYAAWLYEDFSAHEVAEPDAGWKLLKDASCRFASHGVHTYEHLRTLVWLRFDTGEEKYKEALDEYLVKLETCLSPSGGPIGDEWILGKKADPDRTGYEYCSLQELLHSYRLLLRKTGDMKWADRIEWLLFNAGQGARHPYHSAIAYLKSDNSFEMEGRFQCPDEPSMHKTQTRYKYSPVHQDVAVCCVPNAGRIYPYYLEGSWMTRDDRLVRTLYGPSKLEWEWRGCPVTIEETSDYPAETALTYTVQRKTAGHMKLSFRIPEWADEVFVSGIEEAAVGRSEQLLTIDRDWEKETVFTLRFEKSVRRHTSLQGQSYYSYGSLVFARPIEAAEELGRCYREGFQDRFYRSLAPYRPLKAFQAALPIPCRDAGAASVWEKISLDAKLYDETAGECTHVKLVPMGNTILRQVTFPV